MKETVRAWLESEEIAVFLGYRMVEGHPIPYAFHRERLEELEELVEGSARYPLEKMAMEIQANNPNVRIGLLTRGCTQRAVNVLGVLRQLEPERLRMITVGCCPSPLHQSPQCSSLQPPPQLPGKNRWGIYQGTSLEAAEEMEPEERFARWAYEFDKCIKCYGCRGICPVCVCKDCSLAGEDLVEKGWLPVEVPLFHLVRAVHMAGRCVDCGLCEEACPADIPLRLLYRKVATIVKDLFDYVPGLATEPLSLGPMGEEEKRRFAAGGIGLAE